MPSMWIDFLSRVINFYQRTQEKMTFSLGVRMYERLRVKVKLDPLNLYVYARNRSDIASSSFSRVRT